MEEEIIKQNNELSRNLKTRTKKKKDDFKEKECSVINYNNSLKTLDINFDGYGIKIRDVKHFSYPTTTVRVKYKSEIGQPDFSIKLL